MATGWSTASSSSSPLPRPSSHQLSRTVFGMNRSSIRGRPGNVLQCIESDRCGQTRSCQSSRELYLADGLSKTDRMYTSDIVGHHSCVNAITLSNLGEEFLVSAGDDQRVLIWRLGDAIQSGSKPLTPITMSARHTSNVFTAAFSCNNQYIFSGGDDSELIKHDFRTGQPISRFEHLDAVYSVATHPSQPEVVVTASADGCVYIVDTREPHRRVDYNMVLCEEMDAYHSAAINPTMQRLVAVCNSHTGTSLYDARQRKRLLHYKFTRWLAAREDAVSASFDSSGSQLFVMHRSFPPCLFDIWDEHYKVSFIDNTGCYKNFVTMKSGCFMGQRDEYVVSGSDDFRVYIWKVPENREERQEHLAGLDIDSCVSTMPHLVLPGHRSIVNQTCYSKVHQVLLTSGVEKIIKVWSHERLNSSNQVSHSRAPPSRERYSISEVDSLIGSSSPVDPLSEDPAVLALFDSLIHNDQGANSLYYDSSSSGDFSDGSALELLREMPFSHLWLSRDSDQDDDTTSRDSEVSFARSSSLDSFTVWSDEEMDELMEVYTSDDDEFSASSESEDDGRVGRISSRHDNLKADEVNKIGVAKNAKSEEEGVQTMNNGQANGGVEESGRDDAVAGSSRGQRLQSQPEPTRHQPSRRVKNTSRNVREKKESSSANSLQESRKDKERRHQPQRKVKSAQSSASNSNEVVMATDSQPSASGSMNGRAMGAGPSGGEGSGQTSRVASGPSRKWTRKMHLKEEEESGRAADRFEQYHAEDFLKPKSPKSFYSKKDPP